MDEKQLLRALFAQAGIVLNGTAPWDIRVHDARFYTGIFKDTELFMGESYMRGWWDCEQLDIFFLSYFVCQPRPKSESRLAFLAEYSQKHCFSVDAEIIGFSITATCVRGRSGAL